MNKSYLFLVLLLFLGFSSCHESRTTKVSVGYDFTAVGSGLIKATLDDEDTHINLTGDLELMYGQIQIFLANPSGDTIFSRSFLAVYNDRFDTTFTPQPGDWVLSYQILKADDDVKPNGTFKFSLTY